MSYFNNYSDFHLQYIRANETVLGPDPYRLVTCIRLPNFYHSLSQKVPLSNYTLSAIFRIPLGIFVTVANSITKL